MCPNQCLQDNKLFFIKECQNTCAKFVTKKYIFEETEQKKWRHDNNFRGKLKQSPRILKRRNFLLVTRCFLLVIRYFLLVTRYILLVTFYSLRVTFYPVLFGTYLLLVVTYWVLITFYSYYIMRLFRKKKIQALLGALLRSVDIV